MSNPTVRFRWTPAAIAILVSLVFLSGGPCGAATFAVDSIAELQTALTTAEANGEDDIVNIAPGVYQPANPIEFTGVENYSITLIGAGPASTIFDGSDIVSMHSVFEIDQQGYPGENAGITVSSLAVSGSGGRGMYLDTSAELNLRNCLLKSNSEGGAYLFSPEGHITVERCSFLSNTFANGQGGGLYAHTMTSFFLRNCVFIGNQATGDGQGKGGGFYGVFDPVTTEDIEIVNNTFVDNSSATTGGGIYLGMWGNTTTVSIFNNIIRSNLANEGGNDGDDLYIDTDQVIFDLFHNDLGDNAEVASGQSEDLVVTNTGNYGYSANIAEDPLFGDGVHLSALSPCINAGNDGAPHLPPTDYEGEDRIAGPNVDIGADEFHLPLFADGFETGDTSGWQG